jgi:hypothetical protein
MTSKYFLAQVRDLSATPDLYMIDYPQKRVTLSEYAHLLIHSKVMKKEKKSKISKSKLD